MVLKYAIVGGRWGLVSLAAFKAVVGCRECPWWVRFPPAPASLCGRGFVNPGSRLTKDAVGE